MKPSTETTQSGATSIPVIDYLTTGLASWLIPGAGHFMLGYRVRGIILAVSLVGLFWYGERVLADNMAVSRQVSPIFFCLQMGNGASTLVAQNRWGTPRMRMNDRTPDRELPVGYHLGVLFTTMTGLLNMLAILHVLDPRTWALARAHAAEAAGGTEGPSEETASAQSEA